MRNFVDDDEDMFRVKIVSIKGVPNPEFNWSTNRHVPRYLYPEGGDTQTRYYGPYNNEVVARTAATNGYARSVAGFISQTVQKVKKIEWEDYTPPCRTCGHVDLPSTAISNDTNYDDRIYDDRIDYTSRSAFPRYL